MWLEVNHNRNECRYSQSKNRKGMREQLIFLKSFFESVVQYRAPNPNDKAKM